MPDYPRRRPAEGHLPLTVPVFQILLAVADQDLHGYAIIQDIRDRTSGEVELTAYGNVLAAIGFLRGVAAEELERRALDVRDAYFPVLVAARATKAAA